MIECNSIEVALRHGCSVHLLHIFGAPFPKNSSEGLLLNFTLSLRKICKFVYLYMRQSTQEWTK